MSIEEAKKLQKEIFFDERQQEKKNLEFHQRQL